MKKALAITTLAAIVGLTGFSQASAYMGHGGARAHGMGSGPGFAMNAPAQMDEATKAKFTVFLKDTKELRKQMVVKHAEKRALMHAEAPDPQKVGILAGELFDLRVSMHEQAEAAGLGDVIGRGNRCGQNDRQGYHHRGRGMKNGSGKVPGQGPAKN